MMGDISFSALVSTLRNGYSHTAKNQPSRSPIFTVIHNEYTIVCALSQDLCLTILFAVNVFVTHVEEEGDGDGRLSWELLVNNKEVMFGTCYFCDGPVIDIVMGSYDFRRNGTLFSFKKVPARLCKQCGEKYFSPQIAEKLNQQADKAVSMANSGEGYFLEKEEAYVIQFGKGSGAA